MGKRDGLRRRGPRYQPRPRVLIVCEGTVTEPRYFQAVRHVERSLIDLKIEPGSTPKTIVERAVELKKQADREAKRLADDNLKYDEVSRVFDVDDHSLRAADLEKWHDYRDTQGENPSTMVHK